MPATSRSLSRGQLALAVLGLFFLVFLVLGAAHAGETKGQEIRRVEAKKVCMVNNQLFEKDMIPIAVEGKTYYGCCEMCKERLAKDAAARMAVDPVTGNKVDKATAVIAALPDGSILYFESETTFEQYGKK
jgi:YHS domain-containing protein